MTRKRDHERIHRALDNLDALVASHPELQTPESMGRVDHWMEDQMAKEKGKRPGVFVRMTDDLLARVDQYVERMAREQPGTLPTRSDAIRVLVYKGLEAVGEESETRRRAR